MVTPESKNALSKITSQNIFALETAAILSGLTPFLDVASERKITERLYLPAKLIRITLQCFRLQEFNAEVSNPIMTISISFSKNSMIGCSTPRFQALHDGLGFKGTVILVAISIIGFELWMSEYYRLFCATSVCDVSRLLFRTEKYEPQGEMRAVISSINCRHLMWLLISNNISHWQYLRENFAVSCTRFQAWGTHRCLIASSSFWYSQNHMMMMIVTKIFACSVFQVMVMKLLHEIFFRW